MDPRMCSPDAALLVESDQENIGDLREQQSRLQCFLLIVPNKNAMMFSGMHHSPRKRVIGARQGKLRTSFPCKFNNDFICVHLAFLHSEIVTTHFPSESISIHSPVCKCALRIGCLHIQITQSSQ